MMSFKVTKEEAAIIAKIAERAQPFYDEHAQEVAQRPIDTQMDLCATIANGCPLRLDELLLADDFNFTHDIFGIRCHINRTTGKLEGFFRPRFAK